MSKQTSPALNGETIGTYTENEWLEIFWNMVAPKESLRSLLRELIDAARAQGAEKMPRWVPMGTSCTCYLTSKGVLGYVRDLSTLGDKGFRGCFWGATGTTEDRERKWCKTKPEARKWVEQQCEQPKVEDA